MSKPTIAQMEALSRDIYNRVATDVERTASDTDDDLTIVYWGGLSPAARVDLVPLMAKLIEAIGMAVMTCSTITAEEGQS